MSVATLSETRVFNRRLEFFADKVLPSIVQNAYSHSPAVAIFLGRLIDQMFGSERMSGSAKRLEGGGNSIQVKHNLDSNSSAKWLTGPWDTVDTTPSDTVRHSRAERKHASATVTISEEDRLLNGGSEERMADLLSFEFDNAVSSLVDMAASAIYSGDGVTEFTGLDTLISANDSVQSLSGATYTNWNSRGVSARGTAPGSVSFAGGSFATTGLSNMLITFLNASEGTIKPQVGLTTYDIYRFLWNTLQPQERFTNANAASAGFESLAFQNVPILPDSKCTSGEQIWINTTAVYASVLPGADFTALPFEMAESQEARTSKIMLKGNLVSTDRRLVNKTTGITA